MAGKGISVQKKEKKSLLTIYKSSLRPLTYYGIIIYDQLDNESFCEKYRISVL